MKLSFVIPAYNEENYIADCLESILRQAQEAPCDVEIIVVNNASTDRTAEVVQRYPGVTLVHEPKKGIVHARRAGYLAATGDLIANVDSDSRLTPDWVKKVANSFATDSDLAALSGPFVYYDMPRRTNVLAKIHYGIGYCFDRFVIRKQSMLQGGNFIVRRDMMEKIGGYDTTIEFYGEDTDIGRRMAKVGHVKFTFDLPMYSSGRRLAKEGVFTMAFRYSLNHAWIVFFKRPYTKEYIDIRETESTKKK